MELREHPSFLRAANRATAVRKGKEPPEKNDSGQDEDEESGGHICLIIGYNRAADEIAISDSSGPRFAERWVLAEKAKSVAYEDSHMHAIKW